jgi:pyruvate/2-oxoglutarate dehydrogenase complex dihydrolipoamide acyltransferase (E2) component
MFTAMPKHHEATVIPYTKLRRVLAIMYPSVQRKPMIHGLFDVDVTKARAYFREKKAATGQTLSFTAFLIGCLARAVAEEPSVQACRKGRRQLIIYDAVDVAIPIEREVGEQKQLIVFIVRSANAKSFFEIHREIRAAQTLPIETVWEGFTLGVRLQMLPMIVIRIIWGVFTWMLQAYPSLLKRYRGTVGITSVGMFGNGSGWGIPINDHTLDVTVGGIAEKLMVIDGQIAMRESLSVTLSFNHALIDGAPAARFAGRLKELIENGYGLDAQ